MPIYRDIGWFIWISQFFIFSHFNKSWETDIRTDVSKKAVYDQYSKAQKCLPLRPDVHPVLTHLEWPSILSFCWRLYIFQGFFILLMRKHESGFFIITNNIRDRVLSENFSRFSEADKTFIRFWILKAWKNSVMEKGRSSLFKPFWSDEQDQGFKVGPWRSSLSYFAILKPAQDQSSSV